MNIFKTSPEFGWDVEKQDVRRMIRFKSRKFGTSNSVKAYACALKGDGKIDSFDFLSVLLGGGVCRYVWLWIGRKIGRNARAYTHFFFSFISLFRVSMTGIVHGLTGELCISPAVPLKFVERYTTVNSECLQVFGGQTKLNKILE